mgnify:CR=1 FL=1
MKISLSKLLLMAVAVVAVACSSEVDSDSPNFKEPIEKVSIAVPTAADSRTTIDPDGMTTRWATGDKLAVWAKNEAGDYVLSGAQFMMHHYSEEFDYAFFDANIPAMAEGGYTYYLSYPMPNSVNGTEVTYSVAQTQSGVYDGKYDIMLAEVPAVAEALSTSATTLNTVMRHQMHAVKITIPEGRNLYDGRFYRLEITFPEGSGVVGDITFDVANPEAKPTYSNLSNVVVVESAEGFDAGSEIWVFVLPGSVDGDVSYRVRGERRHSNVATYSLSKEFVKGHITPINMAIPTIYPYYSAAIITVEQNNLGEEYNTVRVYDANGGLLGEYPRNDKGVYIVDYEGEFDCDQYDNTSWRVEFDSEHAIVSSYVAMGDMTDYTSHNYTTDVPYLFYEDFSALATFDGDYTGGPYTSTSNASIAGRDLSQYGIATGWTGARTGCDAAGTAILVSGRTDYVIAGATRAYGRLESPALSAIKPDKSVKVKVTFDYGGSRSGGSWAYAVAKVGYTTTQGILNGYATQFNNNAAFSGIDGAIDVPDIPTSGSASALTLSMSYNIDVCTSLHRLSWHIGSLGTTFIGNGYQWMYIDNIKVQIVE